MQTRKIVLASTLGVFLSIMATSCTQSQTTFTNPILQRPSADPSVAFVNGTYYVVRSGCNQQTSPVICVRAASQLPDLAGSPNQVVWTAPSGAPNSYEVWAPEIVNLNGQWYIYYAADGDNNNSHRLFALVPSDNANPLGTWVEANTGAPHGQIITDWKSDWAIDPTVFQASDNAYYLAYSCRQDNSGSPSGNAQSICLSQMSDPLHLATNPQTGKEVVELSFPSQSWETRGFPTEEGPFGLTHQSQGQSKDYIFFSASFSGTPDQYNVGVLVNDHPPQPNGGNPLMNPASWIKLGPVFDGHHASYGTASSVFVPSPDGTEVWNVYHGTDCINNCPQQNGKTWADRSIRTQKAEWSDAGELELGYPVDIANLDGTGQAVPLPYPSTDGIPKTYAPWGPAFGDAAEGSTNGNTQGSWTITDASTITSTSLDPHIFDRQFSQVNPNWLSYTVYTQVQLLQTGTGDPHPKYGVYAAYVDSNNWIVAMFDVTSCGANGCVALGVRTSQTGTTNWYNGTLPAGFNPSAYNTLALQVNHGTVTVLVNDNVLSGAWDGQTFNLSDGQVHDGNGQAGVVVENTEAAYANFHVSPGIPLDSVSSGQKYAFRNYQSNFNLDNSGSTSNGAAIIEWWTSATYPNLIDPRQSWTLSDKGNGYFTIISAKSGQCLDDPWGNKTPSRTLPQAPGSSTMLWQQPCNGAPAQNWRFIPVGVDRGFLIQNQSSGLVIDAYNSNQGTQMWGNTQNGSDLQVWQLIVQ